MKKKGFTLVELLAVIVILAVIVLISVPMLLNVINTSKKGALKASAYGIIDAANVYIASNLKTGIKENLEFTCKKNKCTAGSEVINFKGSLEDGYLTITPNGKSILCIDDGESYVLKTYDSKDVTTGIGTCTGSVDPKTLEYTVTTLANFGELRLKVSTSSTLDNSKKGKNNDIVVISEIDNKGKYFTSFDAPSAVEDGMIWLQQSQISKASIKSEYQDIPLGNCYQYVEGKWETRDAYIYDENWIKFASKSFWETLVVKTGKKVSDYQSMTDVATDNEIIDIIFSNQEVLNYLYENATSEFIELLMNNTYFIEKVISKKDVLIYIGEHDEWLKIMKANDKYKDTYVPMLLSSTTLTNDEKYSYGYPIYIFNGGAVSGYFSGTGTRWSSFGSSSDCSYTISSIVQTYCSAEPGSCSGSVAGSSKAIDVTKYIRMGIVVNADAGYSSFGLGKSVPNIMNVSPSISGSGAGTKYLDLSSITGSYYPTFRSYSCFGSSNRITYYANYSKIWFE